MLGLVPDSWGELTLTSVFGVPDGKKAATAHIRTSMAAQR